jgi:hypothetical protein
MSPISVWFRKSVWMIAIATLLSATSAQADEAKPQEAAPSVTAKFSQVYYRYIPEQNFQRISEFFSGEEDSGVRKILRSNAESRGGFYYILRVKPTWNKLPAGSILRVEYVPAGGLKAVSYDFQLGEQLKDWSGEVFFGLTGEQWKSTSKWDQPIAWKLLLLGPDGTVLASTQSMLWEHKEPK